MERLTIMQLKVGMLIGGIAFVVGVLGFIFVRQLPSGTAPWALVATVAGLAFYGGCRAVIWLNGD